VVELGPDRRRVQVECRTLDPGPQGRRLVSLCDLTPEAEEAAAQKLPPQDLLQQMTHRAGNNLQMISSILSLELRASPRGLPPERVASLLHRVKLMGESYRLLCRQPRPAAVELESFLPELVQSLGGLISNDLVEISLGLQGPLPTLELDRVQTLGLVIGELVTNAARHAFFPGQGGMVRVEAASPDGRQVVVKVSDNGQGLPAEVDWKAGPSLGFLCIRSLAQRHLAAEISLSPGAGTCFTIRLRP
jgi:two-component sensor histidine kinase